MRYERDGFSVRAAIKKKRKLPDWYLDEPKHPPGCEFFYEAFRDLQTCRYPDGAIPWTAAREWSREKRLTPDVAEAVWIVVSRMDRAERNWHYENLKASFGKDEKDRKEGDGDG